MRNNRTSAVQYWYIPLPLPLCIVRKNGQPEVVKCHVPLRRPSLHWMLFFIGMANLAKTHIAAAHLHGSVVPWIYLGCMAASAGTAKIALKVATDERIPRSLTGLLGIAGIGYSTLATSGGAQAAVPVSAAITTMLLTLMGEGGYRIYHRRAGRAAQPDEHDREQSARPQSVSAEQDHVRSTPVTALPTSTGKAKGRPNSRRRRSGRRGSPQNQRQRGTARAA